MYKALISFSIRICVLRLLYNQILKFHCCEIIKYLITSLLHSLNILPIIFPTKVDQEVDWISCFVWIPKKFVQKSTVSTPQSSFTFALWKLIEKEQRSVLFRCGIWKTKIIFVIRKMKATKTKAVAKSATAFNEVFIIAE